MPFVKVPEQFAKTAKLNDIAVYVAIKKHANNETGVCYPSQKRIADMLGISEATVKRSVKNLKEMRVVEVTPKHKPNSKEINNYYTFELLISNYVTVDTKIFELGLSYEAIGLLVKLRSWTYENSLRINFCKEKIASICGIGKAKLNKYLDILTEYISYKDCVLSLTSELFQDNSRKAIKLRNMANRIKARKQQLVNMAKAILQKAPESKEAKKIKHYFIDEKKTVKHPMSLLSHILYGVSYKKPVKYEPEHNMAL